LGETETTEHRNDGTSEPRNIGTAETQTEGTRTRADTSGTAAETSETQTLRQAETQSFEKKRLGMPLTGVPSVWRDIPFF
jgi:hypothetical protein